MKNLVFVLSAFVGLTFLNISCSNTVAQEQSENQTTSTNQEQVQNQTDQAVNQEPQKEQLVKVSTEYGDMVIKLYNETPLHRDNFIKLAKEGYYNGTLFHRVIQGFMIQGGDPNSKGAAPGVQLGNGGPGYTIPAEFNPKLIHKKGALAAARMGDNVNPKKESSGSQFYIVQGRTLSNLDLNSMGQRMGIKYTEEQKEAYIKVGGTPFLDRQYTVFGEVVQGLEVIDLIAAVKTIPGDRPEKDVSMTVSLIEE